jgi:hypothetical protein
MTEETIESRSDFGQKHAEHGATPTHWPNNLRALGGVVRNSMAPHFGHSVAP